MAQDEKEPPLVKVGGLLSVELVLLKPDVCKNNGHLVCKAHIAGSWREGRAGALAPNPSP